MGRWHSRSRRRGHGHSLAMLDHALVVNPSDAFGWFWSGFLRLFAGSTETAIERFEKHAVNPRTPLRHFHHTGLGACYFLQRRLTRPPRCWRDRCGRCRPMLRQPISSRPATPIWSRWTMRRGPGPFAVDRISSGAASGTGSSRSHAARALGLGPATRGGRGGLTATAVKFGRI